VPKTLVLELLQNGFEGRRAGNAVRARLVAPQAVVEAHEVLWTEAPRLAEGEAAPMPRLKMPRLAEFEEWTAMPGPEGMGLEVRDMAEPECETSVVAEPTLVAEATEGPWLKVAVLPEEAVMVELKAMMRQMKSRAGVWWEMAETEGAVTRLHYVRCHSYRGQDSCKDQGLAHHFAPWSNILHGQRVMLWVLLQR
jgi:hypothetical protein